MNIDPHAAQQVESKLLELKDQALEATKRADGDFYRRYLADDTIAIVPYGIFNKQQVVEQMSSSANPLRSSAVTDVRAIALSSDCGLVTYRASYPSGDVFVSSLYLKRDGVWQGVFYQQTPVEGSS